KVLPVRVSPDEVTLAVSDPYDTGWVAELAPRIKQAIKLVLANPKDIERYLVEFYALARSLKASQNQQRRPGLQNLEQLTELGKLGKLS
ncbi:hypothetical protein ABTL77_20080, partial [Acinetobacter baumannii]